MNEFDQRPSTVAGACALGAALVATAAAMAGAPSSIALTLLGTALFAAGLHSGVSVAFDLGPFILFAGVLQSGVQGGSVVLTLVATIAVVVAWDLGHTARDIGSQLGRDATTVRLELARVLVTLSVGVFSTTIGYAVFTVARSGDSNAAIAALIGTVFFATVALGTGNRTVRRVSR